MREIKIGKKYRHFKGMEYQVIGTAKHSETLEPMVVYRALYGDHGLWVRPASMWCEKFFNGVYDSITNNGMPFFYCGVVVMVMFLGFFFVKSIKMQKKLLLIAITAFFISSFFILFLIFSVFFFVLVIGNLLHFVLHFKSGSLCLRWAKICGGDGKICFHIA